jgi:hypothetical protein
MYEHKTTDELHRLQKECFDQLTRQESLWKPAYFILGLLSAMGGALLIIVHGVHAIGGLLLAGGLPAIWMARQDERKRAVIESLYKQMNAELAKRRAPPGRGKI